MPEVRVRQNKFDTDLYSIPLTLAEVSNKALRPIPRGDVQKFQTVPLTYGCGKQN